MGAQELLAPYTKRPHVVPRKRIVMRVGPPVELDDLRAQERTGAVVNAATDRIMAAITREAGAGPRRAGAGGALRHGGARGSFQEEEGGLMGNKVAVLGAGSWGTAFSIVLADAGNDVSIWARREEVAATINERHENVDYLPGIELPRRIASTHDPEQALAGADIVVLAVPSQSLRDNLPTFLPYVEQDAVLVSLMKGVELGTLKRMSEVIAEVGDVGAGRIADRSAVPTSPVRSPVASPPPPSSRAPTRRSRPCCRSGSYSPAFRPYTSVDVLGCEFGGAYKNVVALCVGMAVGLGFGDNTTASLITRGLAETARLAMNQGANPLTLMGLAGLGDLVATCSSPLSRNRTFGEKLGQGMTVEDIYASTRQVAEGAKSCSSLRALAAATGVDAPIVDAVDEVVQGRLTTAQLMEAFINRDTKAELS